MNESTPPPYIPQSNIPQPAGVGGNPTPSPDSHLPISTLATAIESILRNPQRVMCQLQKPGAGRLIGFMLVVAIFCALIYGVIVGSFSGGVQWWASPLKVCGGLFVSTLICLPSLYIFTSMSGAQSRLVEIVGLVVGMLMLMTLLLVGFAPVAWLFSQSTNALAWMGFLHLTFWFISTIFGMRFLSAGFSHAKARSSSGLMTWAVIFMLVAVQMTTALRPLVGQAETLLPTEKKFFIAHWIDCMK